MFSLFLQLCLAALCSAAPIADDFTTLNSNATQYGTGGGIVGFIVLVLDILVWSKFLTAHTHHRNTQCADTTFL
jgi:hypothetical protein